MLEFFNNLWGIGTEWNRVVAPARQATQPGGVGSLESILGGLIESLKIQAQGVLVHGQANFSQQGTVEMPATEIMPAT